LSTIDEVIDSKIGDVSTDSIDISIGEIISLHSSSELVIYPEYQRLFRWSEEQQSRLIESVLLKLPIPPIYVIENTDGVLELVDGLQRVSSFIHFIDVERWRAEDDLAQPYLPHEQLVLKGCELVQELDGNSFADLPLVLKLALKRSPIRMVVIKKRSISILRYEMFKRLNTGGLDASPQEIRNCTVRMAGSRGVEFYKFLQDCANDEQFKICTESLSDIDLKQKSDEELVLRFFAAKNARNGFKGSVREWLDAYMERVVLKNEQFDYAAEGSAFRGVFEFLAAAVGSGAFVRYRGDDPVGGLAPAYFEAVTMAVFELLPTLDRSRPHGSIRKALAGAVQGEEFRKYTGPGANSLEKLNGRISVIKNALDS
jgi:hypothetical protein